MADRETARKDTPSSLAELLEGKAILITGGTGSLGQALVRAILGEYQPEKVAVLSRDEQKQDAMRHALSDERLRFFLGDIRDKERLLRAFEGVDIIIHAAALKIVPALEYNPREAILTNIIGGLNVMDAALDKGVERVMAVSTDKAVNPINAYGASKLMLEKLMIQANAYRGDKPTRFSCVRYGNVLASRGSVVPVWREQAKHNLITITSTDMTRFVITIPQAVQFVLSSLAMMQGGEIFVPKLPSCGVINLAEAVAPGCEWEVIGVRPGEKIAELMVSEQESGRTVDLGDRYAVLPAHPWWPQQTYASYPKVPAGWSYASDSNDQWLKTDDLRAMLEGI